MLTKYEKGSTEAESVWIQNDHWSHK